MPECLAFMHCCVLSCPVLGGPCAVEGGACEVLLFHQEDMGIQRDVAKMGVRQGMWGAVRKIEPGVRSFSRWQEEKGAPFSRSLSMARLHTPLPDLASSVLGRSSTSLCLRSGKWVSSGDLRQEEEGGKDGISADVDGGDRKGMAAERGAGDREDEEAAGRREEGEAAGEPPTSLRLPGRSERGAGAPGQEGILEKGALQGDGQSAGASGHSLVLVQARGAKLSQGTSGTSSEAEDVLEHRKDATKLGNKRSPRHMRLFVAATAVAFVCGLETGVLVKLAVAGAIRHALCARGRNRGQ